MPPNSGDNLFGVGLWILYICKYTDGFPIRLSGVITNKTKIKDNFCLYLPFDTEVGEVLSRVECLHMHEGMKSGDRIMVSFKSSPVLSSSVKETFHVGGHGEVKVKMFWANLIQNNLVSIPDFMPCFFWPGIPIHRDMH